ncbi:hypothetical protein Pla108_16000 [Botrimarina colliarenosi]|uniref:Uncharacterized protein n=1 Tax=Botrimarina colliarenosi TaxID=2528001 RepID=A0A5C6AMC3_9BACT|nr:hypothetical protein [Botrimarina colliarenosi]TWU00648.1 hypothetical protein Pla108_16000 [Botrimarina colliarenosi]
MQPGHNRIASHFAALAGSDGSGAWRSSAPATPRRRFELNSPEASSPTPASWRRQSNRLGALLRTITLLASGAALLLVAGPISLVASGSFLSQAIGLPTFVSFDVPTTILAFAGVLIGYFFLLMGGFSVLLARDHQE